MSDDPGPVAGMLVVSVDGTSRTVDPRHGAVTIGRDAAASIRIDDPRVSRSHLRLEPGDGHWQVIDTSSNGMYISGSRCPEAIIDAAMTVHLGAAQGIPVEFTPSAPGAEPPLGPSVDREADLDTEMDSDEISQTADPDVARAGKAVAARRRELEITQRGLARQKIINAGALIAFEKGRSWPRHTTLAKLEEVLQWPPGTIAGIRAGEDAEERTDEDVSAARTARIDTALIVDTIDLAMHAISAAVASLPAPSDPEFSAQVNAILLDLRKLDGVAGQVVQSARGIRALSSIRRTYRDLMVRAAQAPAATLGQRLYAARMHANLTEEETAAVARVSPETIRAAEADTPIPAGAATAIEAVVGALAAADQV